MRKLTVLLLALCAACSTGAQQEAPKPGAGAGPNDTLARIRAMAGSAACTEDAQCHALPLGAQPCGGPESYLAWSSQQTPAAGIEALGQIYEAERRRANAASGRMSTCQFMPDPGAVCRAGTCQLGAGPVPGAAVAR